MKMRALFRNRIPDAMIAGLCLLTGACKQDGGTTGANLEDSVPGSSRMMALAPAHAMRASPLVDLPAAAGAVASVRAHDYVDGLRQDVILKGGAVKRLQNSITILARESSVQTLDEQVPLSKPTETAIRAEIGAQFPHMSMQVVTRPSSNAYGPYGLALGRAGGDAHCVYMWQWIDKDRIPREAAIAGPMSVRVRLCQDGTTFDTMAALLDQMTIGRADDNGDGAAVVSAPETEPSKPKRIHYVAAARRVHIVRREHDDTAAVTPSDVMHYHVPPAEPAPAKIVSDLPPEATMGPKGGKSY